MTSEGKQCVFCRSRKADSDEDAWPRWLHRLFKTGDVVGFQNRTGEGLVGGGWTLLREWRGRHRVGGFCRKCNNEWMSRLENKVKPILAPMILGQPATLTPVEQKTIARWAYMKTLVFAVGSKRGQIPEPEFAQFYSRRKPPHLSITLLSAIDTFCPGAFFHFTPLTHKDGTGTTYRASFVFGHVLLQVFADRPLGTVVASTKTVRKSNDALVRIWTPTRGLVDWPPTAQLSPKAVQELLDVFHQPRAG